MTLTLIFSYYPSFPYGPRDVLWQESLDLTFSLTYISISSIVSSLDEILSFISFIMLMSLISDVRFEFQICHFHIFIWEKRVYFSLQLISSITKKSKNSKWEPESRN